MCLEKALTVPAFRLTKTDKKNNIYVAYQILNRNLDQNFRRHRILYNLKKVAPY